VSDHNERRKGLGIAAGAEWCHGSEPRGSRESYDALADLFLGGGESSPHDAGESATLKFPGVAAAEFEPRPGAAPGRREAPERSLERTEGDVAPVRNGPGRRGEVTLLVAGHLPIAGNAWVNQYARLAAVEAGVPVALVRERGDEVTVELVGASDALPADGCGSLDGALALAGEWAGRWLVQAAAVGASVRGLGSVEVLTGADDAAVVGCYRALKQLGPSAGLPVRVTVMGAGDDKAASAERRIAGAAAEFMERQIEFGAPIARVGVSAGDVAMGLRVLFQGTVGVGGRALAEAVVEAARRSRATPASRVVPGSPADRPASERDGGFQEATVREIRRGLTAARPPAEPAAPPRAPEKGRPALTSLVHGLRAVRVRCPVAADVEMAVDDGGRLHLLAGEVSAADSLKALTSASAWARLNAELVRAADPGVERLDASSEPVLHLVTEEPRQALRLLDSPVKVHVLVPPSAAPVVRALN